ncbi:MAG: lipopolysaccharide biosynthesis protein [Paracoccaceae bacterium]|nr:lipopolysaccharide biosynthesis protein [Paracoccaceae bacterium]
MKSRHAAIGFSVSLGSFVTSRLLSLAVTVVLARTLGPTGMGLVAFAMLAVEVVDVLRDFGLRETLIYDRTADPKLRTSAFAVIVAVGLFQATVLVLVAPLAQGLLEDPAVTPVLMVLALLFPINSFSAVQEAILQREFRFGWIAAGETLGALAKTLVAFVLVFWGFGVWSLVAAILIGALVKAIVLWVGSDWRPAAVRPTLEKCLELLRYGRHIVISSIMSTVHMRVDQMVIVSMLGEPALGLYFVASRIPDIAIRGVSSVITKVAFPAFSSVAQDIEKITAAYRATVFFTMALIAPVSLGLAATAWHLIPGVFGEEWRDASPVLFLLGLAGVPVALSWPVGDFFKATGKPKYLWMLMVAEFVVTFPLILIAAFSPYGIVAVAGAMLIGDVFASGARLYLLARVEGVGVGVALQAGQRPLLCAIAMALAVYAWLDANPLGLGLGWLLTWGILIGVAFYSLLLAAVDRKNLAIWYRRIASEEQLD